jgi:hypothetical protein
MAIRLPRSDPAQHNAALRAASQPVALFAIVA